MQIGINASYLASKNKTGVENYACLLIKSLLELDSENRYSLFSSKQIDRKTLPNTGNYNLYISPFPRGWHRFRLPLSLLRHKVDVFFDPGYTVPPFISIPTVVPIHDLAHKYFPEVYTANQIRSLERTMHLAQKKADGIVFSSENTRKDFNKFFPGSKALQKVIYMGYDKKNFSTTRNKDLLHLDDPYILSVGRLEKKKNVVNLIRGYVTMRHRNLEIKHRLILCGMPGNGFEEIEKEIKQNMKFGKDIILTGFVADKDLPHLYSKADLFAYPSLYEGFGIPILEAFAAKVPIAASNSSSIPEVAGEAAFYFKAGDSEDIARVLEKAIVDQNSRRQHIALGTKRLKEFSWSNYVNQFLDLLTQVRDENSHST